MDSTPFEFSRVEQGRKVHWTSLGKVMQSDSIKKEKWLFVSPHDDDACIGAGLWMQAALQSGIRIYLLVITDGRMGYCQPEQKDTIIEMRRVETYDSCATLGLDQQYVRYIDYPDGDLFALQGRQARHERPGIESIQGYVGLQNALTYHLRAIGPTRVFIPAATDLHPDHRITHSELMISLFHASGAIWPELGPPIATIPQVYEMAVYCDFSQPPNLRIRAEKHAFDRKLAAIAAFRSQDQIARLVENVRAGGPVEYLHEVNFRFYKPNVYAPLFD